MGKKDASPWTCEHEHEQASMNAWAGLNFYKNILSMLIEY
jgi:hypothetical protein